VFFHAQDTSTSSSSAPGRPPLIGRESEATELDAALRDAGDGQTKVTLRLSYQAPGGSWGYIADRVAVGQVGRIVGR
jgi:hypothetical protein